VTTNETGCESDDALGDFISIEQHLFEQLKLHFRFATFDRNRFNFCYRMWLCRFDKI